MIDSDSSFVERLSKNAIDQINTEILHQFKSRGLTINEGIAVDARLVKSATRKSMGSRINMKRLRVGSIKMENPKSSPAIWNQTGPSKTILRIMV